MATLSIDLVAHLGAIEQDFARAAAAAQSTADKITTAFESTKEAVVKLVEQLALLEGAKLFVEMIAGAIEAEAALVHLAHSTQLSVEQIGGIGFAAKQAGGDMESAAIAIGRLNVNLAKAEEGNAKAEASFKAMGISLKDVNGTLITSDQALARMSEKFSSYEEGPRKAALAQNEFGRGYIAMLALLDQGPEFIQRNIDFWNKYSGVTTESANAAHEFEQRLGELHVLSASFATTLGNDLIPALTATVNAMIGVKEGSTAAQDAAHKLAEGFNFLVSASADVLEALAAIGKAIGAFIATAVAGYEALADIAKNISVTKDLQTNFDAITGAVKGFAVKSTAIHDAYVEDINSTFVAFDRFQKDLAARLSAVSIDFGKGGGAGGWDKLTEAPQLGINGPGAAKETEIEKMIDALTKQSIAAIAAGEGFKHLEEAEFALATNPKLIEATTAQREALLALAKGLDLLTDKYDAFAAGNKLRLKAMEDADKEAERMQAAFNKLIEATPTKQLEDARHDLQLLTDAFNAGTLTVIEYTEAVQTRLHTLPSEFKKVYTEMEELAIQAGKDIETYIGTALQDSLSGNFSKIGADFGKMLEQMAEKAIQTDLVNLLFGKDYASGGGFGGLLTMLIPALTGVGATHATGGFAPANSLSQVAEQGPETLDISGKTYLLTGSQGGMVTPPGKAAANGPTFNISIAAGVSRNEVASLIPQITQQIKAELTTEMQRPGFAGG